MFARLLRPKSETNRPRNTFRLGCELLEDRSVPAIITMYVNTTDDTHLDPILSSIARVPIDSNGNTSLRAAVEYGNAHPQNGAWNTDHYNIDLSLITGGTITLTQNAELNLNTNFNFFNGAITIERPMAPGTPAFRLFSVSANTESHFLNLTLTNGNSASAGGAIWNGGTIHAMSCAFTSNSASFEGGAIATDTDATSIISSCTFTSNFASFDGGAVAALSGSLATSLTNCTLTLNEAQGNGGAVWANEAGSLAISSSTLDNNEATGITSLGGGVYVGSTASVTISDTNITYNTAGSNGGGLYVKDCNLTMTGGSLSYNTADQDGGGFYIRADTKTVNLNQVSVTNNTATNGKGGGGYILEGTLVGTLTTLTGNVSGVVGFAGIAWKTGSTAMIAVPLNQQTVVNDP